MASGNMHNKFGEVRPAVFELCERTDRHTHHSASQPYWGKVNIQFTTTTTTTVLWPFIRDYPGEPVPEETFTHSHLS